MSAKRIRVLLADDTLIAREGWKRILEFANDIDVVGEATKHHEVVRLVEDLSPDVILMDLKWFGDETAGASTIRQIKTAFPEVKVIAITAYEHLIRDARGAGADDALTKTFSREELTALIRDVASRVLKTNEKDENSFGFPATALSDREREVLTLLQEGYTDKAIALQLQIAENTVKNHVKNILSKLGAQNRTQAVRNARERGLLS